MQTQPESFTDTREAAFAEGNRAFQTSAQTPDYLLLKLIKSKVLVSMPYTSHAFYFKLLVLWRYLNVNLHKRCTREALTDIVYRLASGEYSVMC